MRKRTLPLTTITLCSALILPSCATMKSNTFLGATIGASAGAVGGAVIGAPMHSGSGTLIGAASGAAIGALIGYLTEPKKASTEPIQTDLHESKEEGPNFTTPQVRRVWIPDKIDGNKYIKGHYEYVLEHGSVWTMP